MRVLPTSNAYHALGDLAEAVPLRQQYVSIPYLPAEAATVRFWGHTLKKVAF
jgi:hypothetical protein